MPNFSGLFVYETFTPGDDRTSHHTFRRVQLLQDFTAQTLSGEDVTCRATSQFSLAKLVWDLETDGYDVWLQSGSSQYCVPINGTPQQIRASIAACAAASDGWVMVPEMPPEGPPERPSETPPVSTGILSTGD